MKKIDSIPYLWRRLPLLAPLLGVVFALMLVVPAWAATTVTKDLPITQSVTNPCNGEVVDFKGVYHYVDQFTIDNTGGVHNVHHADLQTTGTGETTGSSYLINTSVNAQYETKVGQEQTSSFVVRAIGKSAPSFTLQSISHITINADGTETVTFTFSAPSCTS